jgi:hypothetical protein
MSVATIGHSSDERMMSSCPSLLGSIIATDGFSPSLLCYHYNYVVVATGRMPIATVVYGPFLQQCAVVVKKLKQKGKTGQIKRK